MEYAKKTNQARPEDQADRPAEENAAGPEAHQDAAHAEGNVTMAKTGHPTAKTALKIHHQTGVSLKNAWKHAKQGTRPPVKKKGK